MATADVSLSVQRPSHDPSAPSPAPVGAAPAPDALDDLFNYDADIDNVFRDVNVPAQQQQGNTAQNVGAREAEMNDALGLGIDEEIKIRKPRKRAAKLDEDRLLSEQGIPKLKRISKDRLKFKGKGHEFSDVTRLLSTYQLWLDDLFPKAKFGDGLVMIEKLGHKKRLQVMRKAWIDEEKHKPESYDLPDADEDFIVGNDAHRETGDAQDDFVPGREQAEAQEESDHEELYARPTPTPPAGGATREPEDDELDALLAEDAARNLDPGRQEGESRPVDMDDFEDDEAAMAEMW